MIHKERINVFWFRRDIRLHDNAGLYRALKGPHPVLPLFIFDTNILEKLDDTDDARVTFIHQALEQLNAGLKQVESTLIVKHNRVEKAWAELIEEFNIDTVFTNNDYEPYGRERDLRVALLLRENGINFESYKDHVIFEKNEILKDDGQPYTVYSAYKRKWYEKLRPGFHLRPYATEKYLHRLCELQATEIPALESIGFRKSTIAFPSQNYQKKIQEYKNTRDIPGIAGTSQVSVHLRFGTLSIRGLGADGLNLSDQTWLGELIWRDFYTMILWHFPATVDHAFKPAFENIHWRNNESEFEAWCQGLTGYPIVDAGMRQLNATGWMHNRVRMITASFLTKHLLIDWRWGEAYFARKLIDYDMANNVGGWQWAAGCGNDAVPYFRIFNPYIQTKKFDPDFKYIKTWIPELSDPFKYPPPIVEHQFARERALREYKRALSNDTYH